ncbi:MAG: hypothetical protein FWH04_07210 [Oscillospiraceae bacterium]|nr:hypothetical protein [Oscillospiraceae bacterium]
MECRRCGKELPDDHEKHCPYCGVQAGTHITARTSGTQKITAKKNSRRNSVMTLVSLGLIVLVAVVAVNLSNRHNKSVLLKEIEGKHTEILAKTGKYTDKYTKTDELNQVEFFKNAVNRFKTSYGKDQNSLVQVNEYEKKILDLRLSDLPESSDPVWLKANAEDYILSDLNYSLLPASSGKEVGLELRWINQSGKTVREALLAFGVLDNEGNPVMADDPEKEGARKELSFVVRCPNKERRGIGPGSKVDELYLSVLSGVDDVQIKPIFIKLTYTDGKTISLPKSVCELWG